MGHQDEKEGTAQTPWVTRRALTKLSLGLNGCSGKYQHTQPSCRKHTPEFAVPEAHLLLFVTHTLGSRCCLYTDGAAERFPASVGEGPPEPSAPSLCSLPGALGLTELAGRFHGESDTEGPRTVLSYGEEAYHREASWSAFAPWWWSRMPARQN